MNLEYNENETENERQEKNKVIVEREVLLLFSYPMQTLFNENVINYDDGENLTYDFCAECQEEIEQVFINGVGSCPKCKRQDTIELEYNEIFEYWVVSEWLFEKLKELGEPVFEWENLKIWGRCTTGQSLALDGVITDVRKMFN